MKYILELEDEPNKEYFGEGNYYRCKQIPYWSISESMRNRLEPYDEADRKTENSSEKPNNCEPQTIRCPKCGRTDYIRDMEKDMGIKGSHYKYKCINCNTYIKDEPQTERSSE